MAYSKAIQMKPQSAVDALDEYLTAIAAAGNEASEYDGSFVFHPAFVNTVGLDAPVASQATNADEIPRGVTVCVLGKPVRSGRDLFQMYRAELMSVNKVRMLKQVRGMSGQYDRVIRFSTASIARKSARISRERLYYGWSAFGMRWECICDQHQMQYDVKYRGSLLHDLAGSYAIHDGHGANLEVIQTMIGVEALRKAHWIVKAKYDGIPSLAFHTDPTGVKEILCTRDIAKGKRRRDALLHWVNAHSRKSRVDPDVEFYVREHLRGSRKCEAGGIEFTIEPSEMEMNAVTTGHDRLYLKRKANASLERELVASCGDTPSQSLEPFKWI